MRKAIVVAAILTWLTGAAFGQGPLKFRSTEWLGLSNGQAGSGFQLQTVNGVAKGPWFAGVGAGIDYYRFRSVPLFLSVTRDIALGKKDWLFVYVDGGKNVAWYTPPAVSADSYLSDVFQGGVYWSGGLGYLWKLGEHSSKAIQFSAGYTMKRLSEEQSGGCPISAICMPGYASIVTYKYLLQAIHFMAGFRF
ncbi:MAG TPA: hypothetical protein VG101_08565 [Puia sp.]|jgi:hypothetical protein|nr:hypothetical protein [Puia sp.]